MPRTSSIASGVTLFLLLLLVAMGIVLLGLSGALVARPVRSEPPVCSNCTCEQAALDATCNDPTQECTLGVSLTLSDGNTTCRIDRAPPGSSCSSACFVDGANLTCNAQQQCVSSNASECKGACQVVLGELNFPIYSTPDPAECVNLFSVYPFFQQDTAESSVSIFQWIIPSVPSTVCAAYGGCTMTLLRIQLFGTQDGVTLPTPGGNQDCLAYLNNTAEELSCIAPQLIDLNPNISNTIGHHIVDFFAGVPSPLPIYQLQMCVYQYRCGPVNTTALSDPIYLQGKRDITSVQTLREQNGQLAHSLLEAHMSHYLAQLQPMMRRYIAARR